MKETRELPQVIQMEIELLGMMLLKGGSIIPTIASILKSEDFFIEEHGELYSLILKCICEGQFPAYLQLTKNCGG